MTAMGNSSHCLPSMLSQMGTKSVGFISSHWARNFLISSMATALSIVPLVQRSSHLLLQMAPQTAGKGLSWRISLTASA